MEQNEQQQPPPHKPRILRRVKSAQYLHWLADNADTLPFAPAPGTTWKRFYESVHHFYETTYGLPVYDPGFDDREVKINDKLIK